MTDGGAAVSLRAVTKRFKAVRAVDGVDLDIRSGEFFSVLGPSGSGKTTVLRLIAGFEQPSSGQILLNGRDVTRTAPFDRDVNTVFQDYALFPHLSVRQNVEYGLRVKRVPRAERARRATAMLATVRLTGLADRRPSELSGGQRQRVALARALVNRPPVLLLDEPLGALDLKLRLEMQGELKRIHREAGVTFVLVTHDQDEALTISDRIAVFNAGRIEQVGTPIEVYERPATTFVAGFVGTANLLRGPEAAEVFGSPGSWAVRPEKIRLTRPDEPPEPTGRVELRAAGRLADIVYAGAQTRFAVDLETGGRLVVLRQNLDSESTRPALPLGSPVTLAWHRDHSIALPD